MRKKTIVIGNITTALNTSAKLGIKTISIIDLLKINNQMAKMFYKSIGIFIPENLQEFENLIN